MVARTQVLVPYHFGKKWDIIPNRNGEWTVVDGRVLLSRLVTISNLQPDIVVAGDCMTAIAAHRNGLPLVWMDAHGDFHTMLTTETGNIGGMPLAMLCGLGDQQIMKSCGKEPISGTNCYHVGGSQFDKHEADRMCASGIHVWQSMNSVPESLQEAGFHLHIDTDVVSSRDLPSSIHPSDNGIALSEFYKTIQLLLPFIKVLSIKTYDPTLDISGIGAAVVLEILRIYHEQ